MQVDRDAEDRLPIELGPIANDEYVPPPQTPLLQEAERRARDLIDRQARRRGMTRRSFLRTTMATAAVLLTLDACSTAEQASRRRSPGGRLRVPEEATVEPDAATEVLGGDEFVFDVQTHYVNYDLAAEGGEWTAIFPFADCAEGATAGDSRACFTADAYFREMFVRSDTSMTILSALPTPNGTGLGAEDMAYAIDVATRIGCNGRVLMHGGAYPHRGPIDAALADILGFANDRLAGLPPPSSC